MRNSERLKKSSPSGEAYKIRHQKTLWFGTFADSLQGYTVCSLFSWFIIFFMLFVLSAPSGTGKTTVANFIIKNVEDIRRVITATTRPKREGEVEGVDYIFLTVEEFEQGIREGMFLEYAKVYGNYYGTPKDQVLKNEEEGYDSLLVIDVQGAMTIKRNFPDSVLVFLLPPSIEELRRRLLTRGYGHENLQERLRTAEWEISCAKHFDYIVVNEFLDETVETLKNIILSSRYTSKNFLANISRFLKDDKIIKLLEKECMEVSHGQKT